MLEQRARQQASKDGEEGKQAALGRIERQAGGAACEASSEIINARLERAARRVKRQGQRIPTLGVGACSDFLRAIGTEGVQSVVKLTIYANLSASVKPVP